MSKYVITGIWIYPVKSLGGIAMSSVQVLQKGILYDRRCTWEARRIGADDCQQIRGADKRILARAPLPARPEEPRSASLEARRGVSKDRAEHQALLHRSPPICLSAKQSADSQSVPKFDIPFHKTVPLRHRRQRSHMRQSIRRRTHGADCDDRNHNERPHT